MMARKRKRSTRDELFAELLNAPCTTWPDCPCGEKERYWQNASEATIDADLDWALLSAACMLSCMAKRCWNAEQRQHCARQLRSWAFDSVRQRLWVQ